MMRPGSRATTVRSTAVATPAPTSTRRNLNEEGLSLKPSLTPWVKLLERADNEFAEGRVVQVYDVQPINIDSPSNYKDRATTWLVRDSDSAYRVRKRVRQRNFSVLTTPESGAGTVHHSNLLTTPGGEPGPSPYPTRDNPVGSEHVYYLREPISVRYGGTTLAVPRGTGVTIVSQTSMAGGPNNVLPSSRVNPKKAHYVVRCYIQTESWYWVRCSKGQLRLALEEITSEGHLKIIRNKQLAGPCVVSANKLTIDQRLGTASKYVEEDDSLR